MDLRMSLRTVVRCSVASAALIAVAGETGAAPMPTALPQQIPEVTTRIDFDLRAMENQLTRQGFEIQSVEMTFLGRMRFVLESDQMTREVVVSRTTGAILRDTLTPKSNTSANSPQSVGAGGAVQSQQNASGGLNVATNSVRDTVNNTVRGTTEAVTGTVGAVAGGLGL